MISTLSLFLVWSKSCPLGKLLFEKVFEHNLCIQIETTYTVTIRVNRDKTTTKIDKDCQSCLSYPSVF